MNDKDMVISYAEDLPDLAPHELDRGAYRPAEPEDEARGDAPWPGYEVFGPVTREDLTRYDGEQSVEIALRKLRFRERGRRAGWSVLWTGPWFRSGRCIRLQWRIAEDEGGDRAAETLLEVFRELGYMVTKKLGRRPVDRSIFGSCERIA